MHPRGPGFGAPRPRRPRLSPHRAPRVIVNRIAVGPQRVVLQMTIGSSTLLSMNARPPHGTATLTATSPPVGRHALHQNVDRRPPARPPGGRH